MYKIQTIQNGYLLTNGATTLHLTGEELRQVAAAADAALDNALSTGQARKLAQKEYGRTIPAPTLISALDRGNIPEAYKDGARWRIPRPAFEQWLNS